MPALPARMAGPARLREELTRLRREPALTQTLRSWAAATLAYVVAVVLTGYRAPLLAPLTALLVVQVTLYETLTSGVRRVNAVVAGVAVAVAFSSLAGLSWWSLSVLILIALTVGHLVRAHQFVPEVAISAMLVLGVTRHESLAYQRIIDTLIGAGVGLLFNLLFAPPVWVQPAEDALVDMARRMRFLLMHVGTELETHTPVHQAAENLHAARRLDNDIAQVDESLVRAEESLRFNPRAKEGLLSRIVLRTGLDTLEIVTVVIRSVSRTLTDLARDRRDEPLFPADTAPAVEELLHRLGEIVHSFALLVTTGASEQAAAAEERLSTSLEAGREARDRVAHLLLGHVQELPRKWQLYGALLAEVDRVLDELDVQKRSERLIEELSRYEEGGPRHILTRLLPRRLRLPRRRRED